MSRFKDWITFDNGIRLKRQNIVGYHKNSNENYTKMFVLGQVEFFPVMESPDDIDVLLGKTVSKQENDDEE